MILEGKDIEKLLAQTLSRSAISPKTAQREKGDKGAALIALKPIA